MHLRRFFRDVPLKKKLQLLVSILALTFVICFSFGIELVSNAANKNLQESAVASLSGAGSQIARQLTALEDISNMILADSTVQDSLTKTSLREIDYFQYRRSFEAMHNIVQYYQNQFYGNYLDCICIINDYYATYSASPYISSLPNDVIQDLSIKAAAGGGAPVFVTDYIDQYDLFLVREIREINGLSLKHLGFMVLCIDLDSLVKDTTSWTSQYDDPDFFIFDGQRLVYSSDPSEEFLTPHNYHKNSYLVEMSSGASHFFVQKSLELTGWNCEISIPYDTINHSIKSATLISFCVMALILSCMVLLTNHLLDTITVRVSSINNKMRRFGADHHDLSAPPEDGEYGKDEIGCLDEQFDHMAHQICELIDKNYVNELLRKDAELEALEKQINPHFLYNTLESVNWRAKAIGETQISAMTEALGHLLRITLSKSTDIHTLKTELDLLNYFMTIQNIRFEDQLDYSQEITPGAENALIPKLTIQPLVENAVHYGMESGDDVCHIKLSIEQKEKDLCIRVANTGSQFPDDFYEGLVEKQYKSRGFGIGLLNIDQRLRINFGDAYHIRFYNEDDWAIVEIHISYFPFKGEK